MIFLTAETIVVRVKRLRGVQQREIKVLTTLYFRLRTSFGNFQFRARLIRFAMLRLASFSQNFEKQAVEGIQISLQLLFCVSNTPLEF